MTDQELRTLARRYTARAIWRAPRYRRRRHLAILGFALIAALALGAVEADAFFRCFKIGGMWRCF